MAVGVGVGIAAVGCSLAASDLKICIGVRVAVGKAGFTAAVMVAGTSSVGSGRGCQVGSLKLPGEYPRAPIRMVGLLPVATRRPGLYHQLCRRSDSGA